MNVKAIETAIRIANRGTAAQIDAIEAEHGRALSTIIDDAWDWAEQNGHARLAAKCERAFNRLTNHHHTEQTR